MQVALADAVESLMLALDCSTLTSLMMPSDEKQSSLSSAASAQSQRDLRAELAKKLISKHYAAWQLHRVQRNPSEGIKGR